MCATMIFMVMHRGATDHKFMVENACVTNHKFMVAHTHLLFF